MLTRVARLVLGFCLLSSISLADAAPPRGTRRVGFEFTVEGVEAFPDRILFAYPCSASSGVPMRELVVLSPGARVRVGSRGGDCPLYAAPKGDFDAWRSTYVPTRTHSDPAAEAFVASAPVVRCHGGPTVVLTRPDSEPDDAIREVLRVTKVDAASCEVVSVSGPPRPASPSRGGCAGCAVAVDRAGVPPLVAGLSWLVLLSWRRRGAGRCSRDP